MATPYTVMLPGGGSITVNANSAEAARANAGVGGGATVIAGGHQTISNPKGETVINPNAHVGAGEIGVAPFAGGGQSAIAWGADQTNPHPAITTGGGPGGQPYAYTGAGAGSLTSTDGQTLASQSADTQASFRAIYGNNAEQAWVQQHNKAIGSGPLTGPPLGTTGSSGRPAWVDQIMSQVQSQATANRAAQLQAERQQQVSNVLGGNVNAANSLSSRLTQPYYATPSNYGSYGGYGGQSYLGSPQQQPNFLDTLLSGIFGSMFSGTPSGGANAAVSPPAAAGSPAANGYLDPSAIQPMVQQAQNVGQQLNATPAAQQQVQQSYSFQPTGAQDNQPKRQIPGNLFQVPSTQMYSNFSPSEQTGLFTFGQGLGISNQDLVSQILGGAPPAGGSTQSFLRNSMRPFGLPY